VHHVGGEGIFPYSDNNTNGVNCKEMRNFRIEYNVVHDIAYIGSPAKPEHASSGQHSALYYNQNNEFPSEAMSDNVMAYNVIYNAEHGVRMKCNANKDTGRAPWAVYNNIICNTDVAVCWYSSGPRNPHNKPGIVCKNNVILNARTAFVQIAPATIKEHDQVIFDHNIYWTEGVERDTHSTVADPKVIDADKADFRLRVGSPAIDAGVNVGFGKDLDGNSVPQGKATDIGPYEYGGTGNRR